MNYTNSIPLNESSLTRRYGGDVDLHTKLLLSNCKLHHIRFCWYLLSLSCIKNTYRNLRTWYMPFRRAVLFLSLEISMPILALGQTNSQGHLLMDVIDHTGHYAVSLSDLVTGPFTGGGRKTTVDFDCWAAHLVLEFNNTTP